MNCAAVNITPAGNGDGVHSGRPQQSQISSYVYSLISTTTPESLSQTSTTFITLPKTTTIRTTTTFTPSSTGSMNTESDRNFSPSYSITRTTVTVTEQAGSTDPGTSFPSRFTPSTANMGGTSTPQTASIGSGAMSMFSTTRAGNTRISPQAQSLSSQSSLSSSSTSAHTETSSVTPQAQSVGPGSSDPSPSASSTTEMMSSLAPQAESSGPGSSMSSSSASPTAHMMSSLIPQAESSGPGSSPPLSLPPRTTQTTTTVTPTPLDSNSATISAPMTSPFPSYGEVTSYVEESKYCTNSKALLCRIGLSEC